MALTKAEKALYAIGALFFGGGAVLALTRSKHGTFKVPAMIVGAGLLVTGGVLTAYMRPRRALSGGFGLANVEEFRAGGMRLVKWHDDKMDLPERVKLIQGLIAGSIKDPENRKTALMLTNGCEARDDMCELKAIFDFTARNIRYTGDIGDHVLEPGQPPEAVDTFQSAKRTLELKGGDCDDHSIFNATMAALNGFPVKLRITSNTGDTWDHIYAIAGVPKLDPRRWIALDTTLGKGRFNKHPSQAKHVDYDA